MDLAHYRALLDEKKRSLPIWIRKAQIWTVRCLSHCALAGPNHSPQAIAFD